MSKSELSDVKLVELVEKDEPLKSKVLHTYKSSCTGKIAEEYLKTNVIRLNDNRSVIEKNLVKTGYAEHEKLTASGNTWSINIIHIMLAIFSLTAKVIELYFYKNKIITGCGKPNSDISLHIEAMFEPPMYIDGIEPPDISTIEEMDGDKVNQFDVPCFVTCGENNFSAIPKDWLPFKDIIETAIAFFMSCKKAANDKNDIVIIISIQVAIVLHLENGSLIGIHFDNIRSSAYEEINSVNTTNNYPTLLYTLEIVKDENGVSRYRMADSDTDKTMGTIVYDVSSSSEEAKANIIEKGSRINPSEEFLPYEAAQILLENAEINLSKAKNGVLTIFNQLHNAITNYGEDCKRVQIRFMVVSIKRTTSEGEILIGYDKQSPNLALDEILAENGQPYQLDSWLKSGLKRYGHINKENQIVEYKNPQTYVQEYGFKDALKLNKIKSKTYKNKEVVDRVSSILVPNEVGRVSSIQVSNEDEDSFD